MKLEAICENIIENIILSSEDEEEDRLNHSDLIDGISQGYKMFQDKNKKKIKSPLWQVRRMGGQLKQLTLVI